LEQVVRMFVEMDVGSVSPSSTSGYEEKRLEAKTVRGFDASGQNDREDKTRKAWASAFPSSTTQDTSHRAQKWNVGPEYRKRLGQLCGYFGKRTPFLRWRVQLHRIREKSFTVRRIWVWALLLVWYFITVRQYFSLY